MKEALSEARNSTAAAISPGLPIRPIGTPLANAVFASGVPVNRLSISVSTVLVLCTMIAVGVQNELRVRQMLQPECFKSSRFRSS